MAEINKKDAMDVQPKPDPADYQARLVPTSSSNAHFQNVCPENFRPFVVADMTHRPQQPVFAPVKSPPPAYNAKAPAPPLAVTFRETGGGPSVEEQYTIECIRSFLGSSDFNEDLCLKAIRHPRLRSQKTSNEEEYLQEVVGVYMDELNHATERNQQRSQTPRPAQGCANRPMQTIEEAAAEMSQQSGAVHVVPTTCTGSTASTTTPMPALTSAAEREQSDIEKAIAESLISQGPPGNRSYISSLPANPEEMLRKEGVSVGLHNTGNTCWFNVVAQLLFHLPRFRRVVYEYVPKQPSLANEEQATEADLVERMRFLFASMDIGNRRYIDPTEALKIVSALAARSRSDVILGRQQDASEMMSNLMEWMEKGLAAPPPGEEEQPKETAPSELIMQPTSPLTASRSVDQMETSPAASVEPTPIIVDGTMPEQKEDVKTEEMVTDSQVAHASEPTSRSHLDWIRDLFHGYQTERATSDKTWTKLEYTSLFPIHVSHGNLHDALEAQQFLNDSGKEPWFESLPAVLIFSLGRYFFNGTKGETEKLNLRFHFPRTIFMDRYMASNYETISNLREERNRLRNELADVRAELKGMNEFPIGDHTDRLTNILKATLRFAGGGDSDGAPNEKMDDDTCPIPLTGPANKVQSFVEDKPPVPPTVSNLPQLKDFAAVLESSTNELIAKHKQLLLREGELIRMIDEIYEREELKRHGYQLHAVAIHQGHANAGHYWAYVRKGIDDDQWEKFNDQRVESAAWSDIESEAIGGTRTTSAYFLLYVSSAAEPWLFSDDCPASSFLAEDVRQQVECENEALETQIERYRCTQNEDGKGNADVYEVPCEDRGSGFSPLPPPINDNEHMLSGTPTENALADPENLAVSLKMYCEPWIDDSSFEVERRKLFALVEFNKSTYPSNITPETVIEHQAKLLYQNVLKHMFVTCVRKTEAAGLEVKPAEIYNKVISNFYNETDNVPCNPRSRPLRSLLDFWYTMGYRYPAKSMRFALVRALITSESEDVAKCARDEIEEFMSITFSPHYIVLFQRASHLYDLVKTLWGVVRQVAAEMNRNNAGNMPRLSSKSIEAVVRLLKMARSVTNIYERVYIEIGNIQGPQYQQHAECVMPCYIMRGINIIPVLCMFATIVQYLVDRVPPREDVAQLLFTSLTFAELVIHRLALWARNGCKDSEKVISHINDTLSMVGAIFPNTTANQKREIIRVS
ncbi:ubiquitinyl hydrolase 1 [Ancylostoma caninum]|uniref:Ubiquitinyl hydrolase 1 n=1 Tax=Ancylostoma caninum TaxID=29170 RepID=A0A368FND7_ANCCA|nr:ubiquitinyl hydrolase 1 [Ancylostoma caninum]